MIKKLVSLDYEFWNELLSLCEGMQSSLLYAGTPPSGESEKSTHVGMKGGSIFQLVKHDLNS